MTRAKVVVLKTSPETVIEDYQRLFEIADVERFLEKGRTTILKDNISWHFFYPAANTTPWQLEGTILGLKGYGYDDLVCVQNDTVVTDEIRFGDNDRLSSAVAQITGADLLINLSNVGGVLDDDKNRSCRSVPITTAAAPRLRV